MTPEQTKLVQESFARIFPVKTRLAYDFYDRLFQIAPEARSLFAEDLTIQREKLADTLAFIVRHLEEPDVLVVTVQGLARRHLRYGMQREHFPPVGAALIHALERDTPGGLSEAEIGAWTAAYETISDIMIDAAWPAAQTPRDKAG